MMERHEIIYTYKSQSSSGLKNIEGRWGTEAGRPYKSPLLCCMLDMMVAHSLPQRLQCNYLGLGPKQFKSLPGTLVSIQS